MTKCNCGNLMNTYGPYDMVIQHEKSPTCCSCFHKNTQKQSNRSVEVNFSGTQSPLIFRHLGGGSRSHHIQRHHLTTATCMVQRWAKMQVKRCLKRKNQMEGFGSTLISDSYDSILFSNSLVTFGDPRESPNDFPLTLITNF